MRTFVRSCRASVALVAIVLCALLASIAAGQVAPMSEPVRLRISWGGQGATAWLGRAWLDDGALADLKLVGRAADNAGSIWLDEGQLLIKSLSPRKLDVIEVAVSAGKDAQLCVELTPAALADPDKQPLPIKVPLAEVLRRPIAVRIDDRGNTLKVEHVPPNAMEIVTDRETMIFAPGEQFSFEIRPQLSDMAPGTSLDVQATLSPGRRGDPIWSAPQRFEVPIEGAPAATITVPLPNVEGVYTIRVSATRSPGFRPRFFPGGAAASAERSFDVVVLDPRPSPTLGSEKWETVLEIDPTSPSWWERLPSWTQLRRLPAMHFRQLGSTRASTIDLPDGRFVELLPTSAGSDPHWQAYTLPVEAVGVPHLLEIDYPTGGDQHFSLSIIEPNAAGVVEAIGRDGGVYVEGFGREVEKQTHRMVFWPRTQSPVLLVTNQHPVSAAMFGHIRVLKRSSAHLMSAPSVRNPADRLVAAYIARPLLGESFGATNGVVKSGGLVSSEAKAFDDWQTFYESATRLSECVRHDGYNSAVVNVMADGSAIYPSEYLSATPLDNSGRATSDIPSRDPLDLLLGVFDRDGLALVPGLQLAAPLPELEALRRGSDPQTSGLEWVGPNGKSWVETYGTQEGLAPYYNLLDPRVQRAVMNVVGELIRRYGRHTSFAGLSIQLSANGYAQLPPLDWGLDDATITRFERDTGIRLAATGPTRFAARHALLTREQAEDWRQWRAEELTKFYAQIAAALNGNSGRDDRRLILTLEDAFAHPHLAARVRPAILGLPNRVDAALHDAGIERSRLSSTPGIVVCPTRYVESMAPLAEHAIDLELNEAFGAWPKLMEANYVSAALLYHRPQRRQLASFQPKSNTWKMNGPLQLVSQPAAHGAAVRQPYVRTLLQHDPAVLLDGGELLPPGQDDSLRQIREIVRQLPTTAKVTDVVKQPVTVRSYAEPQGVTLLVLNASPWAATADISLDVPRTAVMRFLAATGAEPTNEPRTFAAGQQKWPLKLEPFAIRAVRIESPGVRVLDVVARPSQAAQKELEARLTDLENRDLTVPRAYPALVNPSFESPNGAWPIAGWRSTNASATVELDAPKPIDGGATSVHFRSETGPAALESEPFAIPRTGQLAMVVWVRGQKMAAGSELRMTIEAVGPGHRYRSSKPIQLANAGPGANTPNGSEWAPMPILVNDLPLELQGDIRVRFEMTGPGEVWLDDVQLYDLLFPLKWYKFEKAENLELAKLRYAPKSAFEDGRIVDCARVMETYWLRFIAEYTPPVQVAARPAPDSRTPSPPQPNQDEQPAPGISERIKRVIPGFK
jgi:hypothetical protein